MSEYLYCVAAFIAFLCAITPKNRRNEFDKDQD